MEKSREAFRTISEVAEWLDVPTHVLRFWESRFSQIKPVKRAGGRRYYRPSDMRVIGGVKTLLHDQGMTIRGVQKLFREKGIRHVSSYSPALYGDIDDQDDFDVLDQETITAPVTEPVAPSPTARATHSATPAPVAEKAGAEDAEEEVKTGELVFIRAPRANAAEPETASPSLTEADDMPGLEAHPDDAPAVAADDVSEVEETPAPPAPRIPATPDVPDTDPQDDDQTREAHPGIAALVLTANRARLRAHRDVLQDTVSRLKALRARQS